MNSKYQQPVLACGHDQTGYPALSRFGHGDICAECGTREALEGNFLAAKKDRPVPGKIYALTGAGSRPSIAAGNTWAESEVDEYAESNGRIAHQAFESTLELQMQVDMNTAIAFFRNLRGYNEMTAEDTILMLQQIDELIPRAFYYEGNPNNGKRTYTIHIGRESSPVIYLRRNVFDSDKPLPAAVVKTIKHLASATGHADEVSYELSEPNSSGFATEEFRFWWD